MLFSRRGVDASAIWTRLSSEGDRWRDFYGQEDAEWCGVQCRGQCKHGLHPRGWRLQATAVVSSTKLKTFAPVMLYLCARDTKVWSCIFPHVCKCETQNSPIWWLFNCGGCLFLYPENTALVFILSCESSRLLHISAVSTQTELRLFFTLKKLRTFYRSCKRIK